MLLFATVLPLVRISAILDHIGGVRAQKGLFRGCWMVCKILEIFNLATTNAILQKLNMNMYLHESVNQKALRARNSFSWLTLFASLVKLLYKLDNIWGSIPWKTTQNRFKMIATLTSLKLEPRLHLQELGKVCKDFHLAQNVGRESKGVRGCSLKNLWKWPTKNGFFSLFSTFLRRLKNCKIYHVLHWYALLHKNFIKIWAH